MTMLNTHCRHNNGHITRTQFRQGLTILDIPISTPEIAALEARFVNDVGVNYLAFLNAVQPVIPPEFMYVKRLEEARQANAKGALPELHAEGDLEKILLKIKTRVSECVELQCVEVPSFFLYNHVINMSSFCNCITK